MNVKSHATLTYHYDRGDQNIRSVAFSNVAKTEVRDVKLCAKKYCGVEYFMPGDTITYTLIITNPGNYLAKSILIKDKLDQAEFLDSSFQFDFLNSKKYEVTKKVTKNELSFYIETLEAGAVCMITYQVQIEDVLSSFNEIKHSISVSSNEINEFAYEESKTLKQKYAKITCNKKTDEFTYLNSNLNYYITLKNIGNADAHDVELVDQLPKTFELSHAQDAISINNEPTSMYTFDKDTSLLKIIIPDVKANSNEVLVTIKGKIVK